MSVQECLCMRARTTVRNKGSYQYDILLTGYCDCLCRVHYAVAAAPAPHAMPYMPLHESVPKADRAYYMLCIFDLSVRFHANRWSG